MKTIFVNRFFYPDHSATSQILSELAFRLAARGHQVEIITSRLLYTDPGAKLPATETIRNVVVHRVASTRFGRAWLPGRLLDYLSFYLSASWQMFRLAGRGDYLVAKTDPPMISLPAFWAARLKGGILVNWLQDIFPEVAQALGMKGLPAPLYRLLRWSRNRTLRHAAHNVVLGDVMRSYLVEQGVAPRKIEVIHNMAVGPGIEPVKKTNSLLRKQWRLMDKFVACYSGNLGRAHDYQTMLEAACLLKKRKDIHFLFIGGGANLSRLKKAAMDNGLHNISFKPYQELDMLSQSLGVADVHMISLRPELEGLVVPSKLYGIMAAARASICIGSPDGEIASQLKRFTAGYTVPQGDAQALAKTLSELAASPEKTRSLGENARNAFDQNYNTNKLVAQWESLLFR
jgi:glycosyltransferase involved in cell wall biosynthesis